MLRCRRWRPYARRALRCCMSRHTTVTSTSSRCGTRRRWVFVACCVTCVTGVILLHSVLLPTFIGYYHQDCYLSAEDAASLRYVLSRVISLYEESNQTYWLDYGTLLGAYRSGDIIPYDGDGDISRLMPATLREEHEFAAWFSQRLADAGIQGNTMVARVNGVQVDLLRWRRAEGGDGSGGGKGGVLRMYYPPWAAESAVNRLTKTLGMQELQADTILPTRSITFLNATARVPAQSEELLRARYSYTWRVSVPYKWKCWLVPP